MARKAGTRCTLLHELFHAYQILVGQSLDTPIAHYKNLEEWESVMVQNMLCSEYGFVLRGGYTEIDPVFQYLIDAVAGRPEQAPPARSGRPGEFTMQSGSESGLDFVGRLERALGQRRIPEATMQAFSRHFAAHYRTEIEQFTQNNGEFSRRVAALDQQRVPFNPVRDRR